MQVFLLLVGDLVWALGGLQFAATVWSNNLLFQGLESIGGRDTLCEWVQRCCLIVPGVVVVAAKIFGVLQNSFVLPGVGGIALATLFYERKVSQGKESSVSERRIVSVFCGAVAALVLVEGFFRKT